MRNSSEGGELDNSTLFCNGTDIVFSEIEAYITGSGATLLSFLGLTFNLITICALLLHVPVRNHVTTPFVISLACSDLLFSTTILPLQAIKFFNRYILTSVGLGLYYSKVTRLK